MTFEVDEEGGSSEQSGRRRRVMVIARQIGWLRLALSILALGLTVCVARFSWSVPLVLEAEHALFDLRQIQTSPVVEQDDRIVLIPYTDETLINTAVRSPLDRVILAKTLKRLDAMGAKAIGIDVLIDQPQPADPIIIEAFQSMKTPTYLAYASANVAKDKILFRQQEFLEEFQAKIVNSNVRPASIVLQADDDNVLRSWGKPIPNTPKLLPNAMIPEAKQFADYHGSVVFRLPAFKERPIFNSIPIDTFGDDALFETPLGTKLLQRQVEGRYVLIGGNIQDIDIFETPLSRAKAESESRSTWGMEIFGHMLAQILDNRPLTPLPNLALWLAAIGVVAAGGLTAATRLGAARSGIVLIVQLALIIGIPFWLAAQDYETYALSAFGWIIAWFLAFGIVSAAARELGSEQRKFAQSALGKYLPRSIANEILRDPDALSLSGETREIFVVFTDLEGFTKLSHAIKPQMVAKLLNRYLEALSVVVLEHGGTIDKFVGDAVVAFWGAPFSRPDDGERAIKAAIAMHQAGEEFRRAVPEGVPPIGKTRAGVHHGEAVVGNFGGEGRIQYTALGDSMNTAARLESANKQTKTSVLISKEAVELSGLDIFRPMGRIVLRGRATPVTIYQPVPDMPEAERKAFTDLAERAMSGDVSAITALRNESDNHSEDAALENFVYRLTNQEEGGYFVLD